MNDIPCGKCKYFNDEWGDCERYCMHVDSDEVRDTCKFCEVVV